MSQQILLHDYYYSFVFNWNGINTWEEFYIHTDIEDALIGMNWPRTQTYLHLKINEDFCTNLRLVPFSILLVTGLYFGLGISNLY